MKPNIPRRLMLLLSILVVAVLGAVGDSHYRDLGYQNTCAGHLSVIANAMQNYSAEFGRLPPPYIADSEGRSMHSWRILLLKYIHPDLYSRYDFSEPWDGPNNRRLINVLPEIYACPADSNSNHRGETNYVLVTGPGAFFNNGDARNSSSLLGAWSDTVLVVETSGSGIKWLEPRDLNIADLDTTIGSRTANSISSRHYGGAFVLTADSQRHYLSTGLVEPDLRALFAASKDERKAVAERLFRVK